MGHLILNSIKTPTNNMLWGEATSVSEIRYLDCTKSTKS